LRRPNLNATDIRDAYFRRVPETDYSNKLPYGTLQYLREFKVSPIYQQLEFESLLAVGKQKHL
jgi:hypothetical protein